ncbi:hypothetical protein CVO96_16375 [Deinococcus koreensis]|uniref:Uncharacterized protein n=1 Tax=Deinococcus koreensis TaxID=2054903 RepID=A0A2K3V1R9_9DEIO|nr:hypothetical protein CVO96_16375 [Deinococcus koreensis]
MDSMKNLMIGMIGLSGILAACGSSGVAPDGSASARIVDLTTEYTTGAGQYVGCDNVSNASAGRSASTQVKIEFAAAGTIQSVDLSLYSNTSAQEDPNFKENVPASKLQKLENGNYVFYFDANSSTGKLLPTSIVVSPAVQKVKTVTVANKVGNGFYTNLKINTSTSSFDIDSRYLRVIPVYSNCTVQNTAQPLSN